MIRISRRMNGSSRFPILLIITINLVLQFALFHDGFDNQIVNNHSPTKSDAYDYVARARLIANQGDFTEAFSDAYRMPGYPLFIAIFIRLFDQPLLQVRIVQALLSSFIIYFCYLLLSTLLESRPAVQLGSLAAAVWLPFYFFSPILFAESCSFFLYALFLYWLFVGAVRQNFSVGSLALILALLIYFKPNHILLLLPTSLVIWYTLRPGKARSKTVPILKMIAPVAVLILPWSLFVSIQNGQFIPLATNAGANLYLGTGAAFSYDDPTMQGTLHHQLSNELQLFDAERTESLREQGTALTAAERHTLYQREAIKIWLKRPFKTVLYGGAKVLHAFGFSFRGMRDVLLALQFFVSVGASWIVWKRGHHTGVCIFFWSVLCIVALQSFLFLANQRFKLALFDLPAIVITIMACAPFLDDWKQKLQRNHRLSGPGQ